MIARLATLAVGLLLAARLRPRPQPCDRGSWLFDAGPARSAWQLPHDLRPLIFRSPQRGTSPNAAAVAAWCDSLARAVRAGGSLSHALVTVAAEPQVADAIGPLQLALRRGSTLEASVSAARRSDHLDVALTVIGTCARVGGSAAEPLDRAASVLRGRHAIAQERQVHSAQARMSAQVMTWLPVVMLALLVSTSPSTRHTITQPAGLAAVMAGCALNGLGWWWMRRIIDRATR